MTQTVFEKYKRLTLTIFVLLVLVVVCACAEILLRFTTSYDIGYYTAVRKEGVYHYPYGDLLINKDKYPDTDFDLSGAKPRVGYMGDSIIMGVGAGDGHRISDLLEQRYPAYDHWTFGVMGNGLREDLLMELVGKYGLNTIVYGFNLNDFLPPSNSNGEPVADSRQTFSERAVQSLERSLSRHLDWLRGKSYLYTTLRTGAKNVLQSFGFGHTGFKAIELYPHENEDVVRDIAFRFNKIAKNLSTKAVDFCLIIFPYEMQISKQAAATYAGKNIHWEKGFEDGSTQDLFLKYLDIPKVYDARDAFKNVPESPAGTYFVFNKGDKIDFNHPNREGHALITQGLVDSGACRF